MHTPYILIAIVGCYFFIVFVLLRLVTPFMGFKQYLPPTQLPQEIRNAISELENKSGDQRAYLQAVYNLVLGKTLHQWKHARFQALVRLPRLWVADLREIWQSGDFVYCTGINYVAYAMLANSRFFTVKDVRVRHIFLNFVPHQYLQVRIGERWVDFDPAGSGIRGRGLGTHAGFFG